MKNFLILHFLLLSFFSGQAQEGDFFQTHYSPGSGSGRADNVNFDLVQDQRGVIFIANRSGISTFDGKNWDFFETPSAVFSLSIDEENTVYVGGRGGFGKLIRHPDANRHYISLSDGLKDADDIFSTLIHSKKLYAINQNHVFIHDIVKGTTIKIKSEYSGALINLVQVEEEIYVTTEKSGLKLIEKSKLLSPSIKRLNGIFPRFIAAAPDKDKYLVSTRNDKLYVFNGKELTPLPLIPDRKYIENSEVQSGIWLNDTIAALSTLKAGVIFINPLKGSIQQVVNYQTGLPDNEIFAMATDRNSGVWVAHAMGLTRISPAFPFRNFNNYSGLEGKLLSVAKHGKTLYVGTSLGAYYLKEIRNYDETIRQIQVAEEDTLEKSVAPTEEKIENRGRGIFSFLKRIKRSNETEIQSSFQTKSDTSKAVYKTEIERKLLSVNYVYKKIQGIDSKTLQFASVGQRLFCGGLDGLFEIKGSDAVAITRAPIRYFYVSEDHRKIFVNTYGDNMRVFDYTSNDFKEVNIFGDYNDYVQYIFEDNQNRIWFCSTNDLYWVKLTGNEIIEMDEYQIENPFYYETYGTAHADSVMFVNESGIYLLDDEDNKLLKIRGAEDIDRYLPGTNGHIWIHAARKWSTLVPHELSGQVDLLGMFEDISYISANPGQGDYWIIKDQRELYKLSVPADSAFQKRYELHLKNIKTKSQVIDPSQPLTFDQQNSNLVFEFVQPEYSGVMNIQYQYKLAGLSKTWSEWSSAHNIIDFPFLPEGEYTLLVKSRDALGSVHQADPIFFQIVPPFWKKPWFYAFEVSALALLLFISVSLKKLGYKYRLMSRLLALLVLIIVIEFIQTIAENEVNTLSSPAMDFVIQVIVAIIILPLEGGLRKYIFKEKDVKILDFLNFKNRQQINSNTHD